MGSDNPVVWIGYGIAALFLLQYLSRLNRR